MTAQQAATNGVTPGLAVKAKGNFNYGFTILPNVLRDELMPTAGPDAFVLAYLIISWAGEGDRGARLSARYLKGLTRWGPERTKGVKDDLLQAFPQVFSFEPGESKSSRPDTWWVDFDELSRMHAAYLERLKVEQENKRGPGRPKKPVPESDTGFPKAEEKPVPKTETGFFSSKFNSAKNLLWNPTQGCVENRDRPVQASDTLKEKGKEQEKEREEEGDRPPGAGAAGSSSSGDQGQTDQQQAPDGAAAHAARGHTPSQAQDTGSAGGRIDTTTSTEQVPGAAAAALASVSEIRPIAQAELDARPCWSHKSPEMDLLVTYGGTLVRKTLQEPTPVRALPRAQWWTRLTEGEIHLAGLTASREAQREAGNMKTLFYRALDRLVGAIPAEKPADGKPAALGIDPMLKPGDGVRISGTDGIVELVTAATYRVQLVTHETSTIDRSVHAQLSRIERLDYVPVIPTAEGDNVAKGKLWRHKRQGHTVMIKAVDGPTVTFFDGDTLSVFELARQYEAV
ncbi:hypothetical protein [Deinococcus soli (ex Cha et al. 2016)]|uniref:hypothetical protein n=1 Tax=Deinococcus soli (ex Cha et al. 2016) TaxID=1309411 RepID=UPI00166BE4AE|nr:hypothetical protein [Deinococcus soli (ex Cha et al. 2016)]GGB69130.1 hypothetical protein GCM10008019_26690 [Deinococcus soli (ex Cha et al. 2016)]